MHRIAIIAILGAASVFAQTAPPAKPSEPPKPLPQLTQTEQIAIDAVKQEYAEIGKLQQAAQQKVLAILGDFPKAHPGFHLNPQTLAVEANVEPGAAPSTAPAPKK